MATSSRLKTVDGKYYATEEYVKKFVNQNMEESILSGDINEAISGAISGQVSPKIESLESDMNEVQEIITNFFTMNTL